MYVTGTEGIDPEDDLKSLYVATWGEKDTIYEGFLHDVKYSKSYTSFAFDYNALKGVYSSIPGDLYTKIEFIIKEAKEWVQFIL